MGENKLNSIKACLTQQSSIKEDPNMVRKKKSSVCILLQTFQSFRQVEACITNAMCNYKTLFLSACDSRTMLHPFSRKKRSSKYFSESS